MSRRAGQSSALEALKRLHVEPLDPERAGALRRPGNGRPADALTSGSDRRLPSPTVRPRRPPAGASPRRQSPTYRAATIDRSGWSTDSAPHRVGPASSPGAVGRGADGSPEEVGGAWAVGVVPADVADPGARPARSRRGDEGVEANARLTGATAAVLFVLFAAEGLTILRIRPLLTPHVFIGMLLVPPVLLKIGSTSWRFARYYLGAPAYRRKGPPPPLLRLLGPAIVLLTVAVLATGIALLLAPVGDRGELLFLHKASFVLWFGVTTIHVLGHILETARLAPQDWVRRTRRQVRGAGARQWLVASSLVVGLFLAVLVVPHVGPWLTAGLPVHHR